MQRRRLAASGYVDSLGTPMKRSRRILQPSAKLERPLTRQRARRSLQRIYEAAVAAADPAKILRDRVRIAADNLVIETAGRRRIVPLGKKIYLIGVGKGADRAALVWSRLLGARLERAIFIVR